MEIAARKVFRYLLASLAFCLSVPAMAQYVWIDSSNVRHYSDQPPPPSVPVNRILRTPRGKTSVTYEPISQGASTPAKPDAAAKPDSADNPAKAPVTTAEKNADFQKRRMEQAEKDKKAEQDAKRAEEKAKYCEGMQERKRTLEAGHRLARTDKNGERYYMTDEQRAGELEETNRNLEKCK